MSATFFKSAGTITLDTDVTKQHAGPLLRAGISADRLPFRVYSTDLIIQGVGWVELVCQVRRRKRYQPASSAQVLPLTDACVLRADGNEIESERTTFKPYAPALEAVPVSPDSPSYPSVEVFTPEGKHISKTDTFRSLDALEGRRWENPTSCGIDQTTTINDWS